MKLVIAFCFVGTAAAFGGLSLCNTSRESSRSCLCMAQTPLDNHDPFTDLKQQAKQALQRAQASLQDQQFQVVKSLGFDKKKKEKKQSKTPSNILRYKDDPFSGLKQDTEQVFQQAQNSLHRQPSIAIKNLARDDENKDSSDALNNLDQDAVAAAASGALLGAAVVAQNQPDLVPAAALIGGSAALAAASQDGDIGQVTKDILGKPMALLSARLGKLLATKFRHILDGVVTTVKSIPDRMLSSLQRRFDRTKQDILSVPERLMDFVRIKASEGMAEVQNIPMKLAQVKAQMTENFVRYVQATPDRAAAILEKTKQDAMLKILGRKDFDRLVKRGEIKDPFPRPPEMPPPSIVLRQEE